MKNISSFGIQCKIRQAQLSSAELAQRKARGLACRAGLPPLLNTSDIEEVSVKSIKTAKSRTDHGKTRKRTKYIVKNATQLLEEAEEMFVHKPQTETVHGDTSLDQVDMVFIHRNMLEENIDQDWTFLEDANDQEMDEFYDSVLIKPEKPYLKALVSNLHMQSNLIKFSPTYHIRDRNYTSKKVQPVYEVQDYIDEFRHRKMTSSQKVQRAAKRHTGDRKGVN